MRLFSYVVKYDGGSAPNPYYGYCTLAICKPIIRHVAKIGDWVVGTGSVQNIGNDKIIYAMKVTDVKSFEEYFNYKEFEQKIPKNINDTGDNIYKPIGNGKFLQLPSNHSNPDGSEDLKAKEHDLKGENVLISNHFFYFGKDGKHIPERFSNIIKKYSGHKSNFEERFIKEFIDWLSENFKTGIHSEPYDLKKESGVNNETNKSSTSSCGSRQGNRRRTCSNIC